MNVKYLTMGVNQYIYRYQEPAKWLQGVAECFPSQVEGEELVLDPSFGKGGVRYVLIEEGLWVNYLNYMVYEPLNVKKQGINTNSFFTLEFFLSENQFLGASDPTGSSVHSFKDVNMLFTSSKVSADLLVRPQSWLNIIQVQFTEDWLMENVDLDNYHLKEFFTTDEPICFSENLDCRLKKIVVEGLRNYNHKLSLTSNVYQLLEYIFFRFRGMNIIQSTHGLHPDDAQRLFAAKYFMDENFSEDISLKILCEISQMSSSKFKRLFVQVFGKPPYRYHLENKLEKGRELIAEKGISVSETASFLGYMEHGSFTKAFKKHYGILPSEL